MGIFECCTDQRVLCSSARTSAAKLWTAFWADSSRVPGHHNKPHFPLVSCVLGSSRQVRSRLVELRFTSGSGPDICISQ